MNPNIKLHLSLLASWKGGWQVIEGDALSSNPKITLQKYIQVNITTNETSLCGEIRAKNSYLPMARRA